VSWPARNYFTQIPNLIDELDLSPLALALYFHYKRWSAAKIKHAPNVRFLMKKYRASSQSIAAAKSELVNHRLITIERRAHKGRPDIVQVQEIWKRNSDYFEGINTSPVADERQGLDLLSMGDSPLPMNDSFIHDLLFMNGSIKEERNFEKETLERKTRAKLTEESEKRRAKECWRCSGTEMASGIRCDKGIWQPVEFACPNCAEGKQDNQDSP
jgi:hypothetical protein